MEQESALIKVIYGGNSRVITNPLLALKDWVSKKRPTDFYLVRYGSSIHSVMGLEVLRALNIGYTGTVGNGLLTLGYGTPAQFIKTLCGFKDDVNHPLYKPADVEKLLAGAYKNLPETIVSYEYGEILITDCGGKLCRIGDYLTYLSQIQKQELKILLKP